MFEEKTRLKPDKTERTICRRGLKRSSSILKISFLKREEEKGNAINDQSEI
jgi:hypothetical protein